MSAIASPFHGLATELHRTTAVGGTISADTKVGEVSQLGTLEMTSNIIEFNTYGSDFKQKLVGQKDSGTLSITLAFTPADTSHIALKASYDSGAASTYAVRWNSLTENATAEFSAFVSTFSIDTPVEDIVTVTCELAIDGGITYTGTTAV